MASVNKWIGIDMYVSEGMSIPQVSEKTGVPKSTVRSRLLSAGVLRSHKEAAILAFSHGRLNGGRGKKRVFSESHLRNIADANRRRDKSSCKNLTEKQSGYLEHTRGPNKGRSNHIVVMEGIIGRKLEKGECVHHIDHDRKNNSHENLVLMTREEHSRLHAIENIKHRERESNGRLS